MFTPHQSPISRLVFISAHCGTRPDEGNCVYSVAALGLTPGQPVCQFESLVRYGHLGERERCHSHITRDQLAEAPSAESVSRQLIAFAGDVDFSAGHVHGCSCARFHRYSYAGKSECRVNP